jgi:hypothetical protein
MFVTELVSQSPMGWLKALAFYSATRDGWPCDVSVDAWREGGREGGTRTARKQQQRNNKRRGARTKNMLYMFVTELVSQSPMGWLKALASYSATRDGWPCDVSDDAWREG